MQGKLLFLGNANLKNILAAVIDGDILLRLKETQLAHPLRANAARSQVGDAARLKLHADVGDVDFFRNHGQPNRAYFFYR